MNTKNIINLFAGSDPLKIDHIAKKKIGKKFSKEECLALIKDGQASLNDFTLFWRNDIDIVLACLDRKGRDFEYASNEMRENWKVCVKAFKKNPTTLKHMSEEMCCKITSRLTKEQVLLLVEKYGHSLCCLDHKWRDDKDIVLARLKSHGHDLEYVSPRLKDDFDVVLCAIKSAPRAISYASERFYENDDLRAYAFTLHGDTFLVNPRAIQKFSSMDTAMINETAYIDPKTGLEEFDVEAVEKHPTYNKFKKFYSGRVDATYIRKMEDILLGKVIANKKETKDKKASKPSKKNNKVVKEIQEEKPEIITTEVATKTTVDLF